MYKSRPDKFCERKVELDMKELSNFRNCIALARSPKFRFAQFPCVGRDDRLITNINHTKAELIRQ